MLPGGGPGMVGGDSAITQAMSELQTAAADTKTSPDELKKKVAAVLRCPSKSEEQL